MVPRSASEMPRHFILDGFGMTFLHMLCDNVDAHKISSFDSCNVSAHSGNLILSRSSSDSFTGIIVNSKVGRALGLYSYLCIFCN